jgi:hypothetical protein
MNQRRVTTEELEEQKKQREEMLDGGPGLEFRTPDGKLKKLKQLGSSHLNEERKKQRNRQQGDHRQ